MPPGPNLREPRTPKVWVLSDDRPGHRTQVVGLAESLGWGYEVKDLRFGPLNRISNRLLGASLWGLDRARSSKLAPPWPDLVIAMGRRAAPVARWIGAQGGSATRLVQLGRKGADAADGFDLSLTCAHFRLPPHARRLVTTVPITQVTEARLQAEAARWRGLFDGPSPHIAVLVGGATAQHRLDATVARKLARDVVEFAAATRGTLHIVTSRRTGAEATAAIREVVGRSAVVHEWVRDADANPYLGYLALADVLVVTGESESMLAEAAAAAKTLYVYPIPEKPDALKRRLGERVVRSCERGGVLGAVGGWLIEKGLVRPPRRLEEMHAALYRAGMANRFGVPLGSAVRSVQTDTDAIVARVRAVVESERAPRDHPAGRAGLLARLGFIRRSDSRTFWIQGGEADDFAGVGALMEALRERYPRVEPVLVAPADRHLAFYALAATHPETRVVATPSAVAGAAPRMVRRLNPRLVVLLGAARDAEKPVIGAAQQRQVPVLRLGPAASGCAAEPGVEASLAADAELDRVLDVVAPLMQRDLKQSRSERSGRLHPYRLGMALLHSRPGKWLADRRHHRIGCIADLRVALDRPGTILCLGNGPSSEDPRLQQLEFDCLFRVNDRWLDRGFLAKPDMVFTGDRGTVAKVRGAIFGFQDEAAANRLKLQRALGLTGPSLQFVTVDTLGTFLDAMNLSVTPTNGSTMLATAVALAPERLILAGIDLFMDPRGSYPGDTETANAYTPRHDREVEIRIIERALEVFRGEVTIVSEVLNQTLGRQGAAERGTEALKGASGR